MMTLVSKLPEDLQRHILAYTWRPQPAALLDDIRHYSASKRAAEAYYYQAIIVRGREPLPEDTYWFASDLYSAIHAHRTDGGTHVAVRLGGLDVCGRINLMWGMLRPHERDRFIAKRALVWNC
jgi:hypothetical protein